MVKINWCMLFEKKSLTVLKKAVSFQLVSNGLSFVELRAMGEELQTKNMWPKFNMKIASSSTTIRNAFHMRIKEYKTKSLKDLLQEVHMLHPAWYKKYIMIL
jgi:hypothetical protein